MLINVSHINLPAKHERIYSFDKFEFWRNFGRTSLLNLEILDQFGDFNLFILLNKEDKWPPYKLWPIIISGSNWYTLFKNWEINAVSFPALKTFPPKIFVSISLIPIELKGEFNEKTFFTNYVFCIEKETYNNC